jgi:MoxR-like ATPase
MHLITAAWIAGEHSLPLSPLLTGEPGVGKNRIVYEVARRTGKKLYIFQGHEDVTAEDLACAVRFRDDGPGMEYIASPLLTAMAEGGICFIDEIAKIRPRALALLVSVLDERRYIDSTLLGERLPAKQGFRFIAATNTADLSNFPEFLRSRMRPVISVGNADEKEIQAILEAHHPRLQEQIKPLIATFWDKWRGTYGDGEKANPTPRDAINIFNLALSLADAESRGLRTKLAIPPPAELISLDRAEGVSTANVRKAFDEIFEAHKGTVKMTDCKPVQPA